MADGKVFSVDEIRQMVLPLLEKYGLRGARLFGSYARGEADAASDIDLLIDGGEFFRRLNVYALAEELRERANKNVDAFELSELSSGSFRDTVLGEAIAL